MQITDRGNKHFDLREVTLEELDMIFMGLQDQEAVLQEMAEDDQYDAADRPRLLRQLDTCKRMVARLDVVRSNQDRTV